MITQRSRNATIHEGFWYNRHYITTILKTYFLMRFLQYMKYNPKNLQISFVGTNLTHFAGLHFYNDSFKNLTFFIFYLTIFDFPKGIIVTA